MKGKKRIGILALSLAFVDIAASCGNNYSVERNTTPVKEDGAVTIEDSDRTELRSIVLDTSNVKVENGTVDVTGQKMEFAIAAAGTYYIGYTESQRAGRIYSITIDYTL